jgi:hypothetical protein
MERLKKPALLRFASQALAPRVAILASTDQKHCIAEMVADVERKRSRFAQHFSEPVTGTNELL